MNVAELIDLLEQRGHSQYGAEAVTQLEHALQAADLAEQDGAGAPLIAAALLHDLGHLLHHLLDDAPENGIDDHHERAAANRLAPLFPPSVTEPIRLHVAAKRYLCTIDASYIKNLSEPSIISLRLQGGTMTPKEMIEIEKNLYIRDAVRLRRWDDSAKTPNLPTPPLSHFAASLHAAALPVETNA